MKYNELTKEEKDIIEGNATEPPYSGEYADFFVDGIYICKRCNNPLFSSESKFDPETGWPSFDDEIKGGLIRELDKDGIRTSILCSNCRAHIGHVFEGEGLTEKNTRHCANSASLIFIKKGEDIPRKILANED